VVRAVGAYTVPVETMVWLGTVIMVATLVLAFLGRAARPPHRSRPVGPRRRGIRRRPRKPSSGRPAIAGPRSVSCRHSAPEGAARGCAVSGCRTGRPV
ncbi:hypothetical protein ABZ925_37950, partial [Streptomyces sp. NPDC046751]